MLYDYFINLHKKGSLMNYINYVSPHEMGRHIVISSVVGPSVRPSVRPSDRPLHFRVCSISFKPLVEFSNIIMIRCAVRMFGHGRIKVKVIVIVKG